MNNTRTKLFTMGLMPLLAAVTLSGLLAPALATAAPSTSPTHAAALKSVILRLADVRHVFGSKITDSGGRYSTTPAITCTQFPQTSAYTANFSGPIFTKGVTTVIVGLYRFKSTAGPRCNQQFEIQEQKLLGNALGKLTKVGGVGDAALLLDVRTGLKGSPMVYGLTLKFTRGNYRAFVLVQSGKLIRPSDVMALGKVLDGRLKRNA